MSSATAAAQPVYGLLLVRCQPGPPRILAAECNLSTFGWLLRGRIEELLHFSALTLAERTQPGVRQSVKCAGLGGEGEAVDQLPAKLDANLHVYRADSGLACVVAAAASYPTRAAYGLIVRSLDAFAAAFPASLWQATSRRLSLAALKTLLAGAQDPTQSDPLLRLQRELDETKLVVHDSFASVLARGERLEVLLQKSEQLSVMSKAFYKDAKKANACCSYAS